MEPNCFYSMVVPALLLAPAKAECMCPSCKKNHCFCCSMGCARCAQGCICKENTGQLQLLCLM
ncbi:unnamed protein product [Nyctereutes procyonoides]|uniref:Metallothionein n=1 Tax=Nyctereutes procyonoides TaxID=34880 RepID=A0A811YE93_NYCPR|nr:unnamed protein product [Nyctereutes procyonoides]